MGFRHTPTGSSNAAIGRPTETAKLSRKTQPKPARLIARVGALLILAASGCGSAQSAPTHRVEVQSPKTESLTGGKRGGTLTVLAPSGLGYIDPGRAHSPFSYAVMYATQRPLFAYKPNTFAELTPDLASGPAAISANAMTVTVHIRHGVHFSPPVDREVTSTDVAYAIERGANPNVENPYFHTYFYALQGSKQADGGPIPGIETPNRYTIVFHLTEPRGPFVRDALTLPLSAPVPVEFAKRYDARTPSEYGDYQVATGPYMFKSNRDGRVLGIGYSPGRSATLVRNPSWSASTDFRPAYLNQIHLEFGGNATAAGYRVLGGSSLVQNAPVSGPVMRLAYRDFPNQLQVSPGAGVRYIAVNNTRGPFANIDLRKAFWAVLNRVAMTELAGGPLLAQVASHFLYPEIPGFITARAMISGPSSALSYDEHPQGSMAVAENYVRLAGYPSGKYSGHKALQVVGSTGEPDAGETRLVDEALRRLGFKTTFKLVDRSAMFSRFCGIPAREVDVCPDASRVAEIGDGQAVLDTAFNGAYIRPRGNENWGQVDDADIDSAIERESKVVDATRREESWAAVDNGLVFLAVAVPYAWVNEPAIEARDVAGVGDLSNRGMWDYSFTSLK